MGLYCLLILAHEGYCIKKTLLRRRRYIGQFGDMIRLSTNRDAFHFNNYGNYCGLGGDERTDPVDGIDRCCKNHDNCYGTVDKSVCNWSWLGALFISYSWGDLTGAIECFDTDRCRYSVCLCDKLAAECFAKNSYNNLHKKKSLLDIFGRR